MSFRTAFLALAVITSALPAFAQAPADGVWKGTGMQVGRGGVQSTWTIRMTIRQGGGSEIEYPSLGCKGVLTQIANGAEGFEFNERITEGPCIDRGRIVAKQRSGRVFWFWYLPGGGDADASAVLYRDDLLAGLDPNLPRHRNSGAALEDVLGDPTQNVSLLESPAFVMKHSMS